MIKSEHISHNMSAVPNHLEGESSWNLKPIQLVILHMWLEHCKDSFAVKKNKKKYYATFRGKCKRERERWVLDLGFGST